MECLLSHFVVNNAKTATARSQQLSAHERPFILLDEVKWVSLRIVQWTAIIAALLIIFIIVSAPNRPLLIVVLNDARIHFPPFLSF